MGILSWFYDLGVPWKITLGVVGGAVALTSAYGVYTLYRRQEKQPNSINTSTVGKSSLQSAEKRVLVLGLDSAGKSTFLSALANQQVGTISDREASCPTEGFNVICVATEGVSLNIWEIGGAKKFRSYWPNFINDTNVIVYVVDSSASERFQESKNALLKLLSDPKLKQVPLVLLACKQGLPGAKPSQEVAEFFELKRLSSDRQTCSTGFGITADGQVIGLQEAKQLILKYCS